MTLHRCAFVASLILLAAVCFAAIAASSTPHGIAPAPVTIEPGEATPYSEVEP